MVTCSMSMRTKVGVWGCLLSHPCCFLSLWIRWWGQPMLKRGYTCSIQWSLITTSARKICLSNGLALLSHRTQNTRDKTQASEEQNVHEGSSKNQCYQEEEIENECQCQTGWWLHGSRLKRYLLIGILWVRKKKLRRISRSHNGPHHWQNRTKLRNFGSNVVLFYGAETWRLHGD